jgi:hypothetical protein
MVHSLICVRISPDRLTLALGRLQGQTDSPEGLSTYMYTPRVCVYYRRGSPLYTYGAPPPFFLPDSFGSPLYIYIGNILFYSF